MRFNTGKDNGAPTWRERYGKQAGFSVRWRTQRLVADAGLLLNVPAMQGKGGSAVPKVATVAFELASYVRYRTEWSRRNPYSLMHEQMCSVRPDVTFY